MTTIRQIEVKVQAPGEKMVRHIKRIIQKGDKYIYERVNNAGKVLVRVSTMDFDFAESFFEGGSK